MPCFVVSNIVSRQDYMKILRKHYLKLHKSIGRTAFEGFGNKKDKLFSSLCNTIKAMEHNISIFQNDVIGNDEDQLICLYEPLIILDGTLFEANLDANNNVQINEKKYMQVKFNYRSPNYPKESY